MIVKPKPKPKARLGVWMGVGGEMVSGRGGYCKNNSQQHVSHRSLPILSHKERKNCLFPHRGFVVYYAGILKLKTVPLPRYFIL